MERLEQISEVLNLDPFSGKDQAFSAIAAFLQCDQAPPKILALRKLAPGQGVYSVVGALWRDKGGHYWLHGYALGQSRPFSPSTSIYLFRDEQGNYHVENLSSQSPTNIQERTTALPVASYVALYQEQEQEA